jgi:hypothetical protein
VPIILNTWSFIAVSRKNNILRMYINGNLVASRSSTPALFYYNAGIVIGAFNGYFDDWRFTKYARFSDSIARVPLDEAPITNVPPDITINSIDPNKGPTRGGTFITINGTGFTDYTTCTVNGNTLTGITTVNNSIITGYTPVGSVGTANVVVINP